MSDSVAQIRKALRRDCFYTARDVHGNEWKFIVDDEDGEVYGYREVRIFGHQQDASVAIAALLMGHAGA